MDTENLVLGTVVGVGELCGVPSSRRTTKSGNAGPYAAQGLIGVLVAGLVRAGAFRDEGLTWTFGLSLMVVGRLLLRWAVGRVIDSAPSRRRGERGM